MLVNLKTAKSQEEFHCITGVDAPEFWQPFIECNGESQLPWYLPTANTPIKTINVRFIIVKYSENDPRNFSVNNSVHVNHLTDMITSVNAQFASLGFTTDKDCNKETGLVWNPQGTNNSTIVDTRVRIKLKEITEIINPTLWSGAFEHSFSQVTAGSGTNDAINIYLTGGECRYQQMVLLNPSNCTPHQFPSAAFWDGGGRGIFMGDMFNQYTARRNGYHCDPINFPSQYFSACCPTDCPTSWEHAKGLLHELGHALGIGHANQCPTSIASQNGFNFYNLGFTLYDLQIARMHSLMNSTLYRNAVECDNTAADWEITQNATWVVPVRASGNIVVKTGVTLTISCKVFMPTNTKIMVEPGGKLIVDAGNISNACKNEFWQGIEAWGNTNSPQTATNQGTVEIKNGAIIENARKGVTNWKSLDFAKIGGIITTNNASFINCRRSVEFIQYKNMIPSTTIELGNVSNFKNTLFTVNNNYLPANDFSFHVTMWGVKSVKFEGCVFSNTQTTKSFAAGRNGGIGSIDAGYLIQPLASLNKRCEFIGLNIGVEVMGSVNANYARIDQSDFTGNRIGVQVKEGSYAEITRNNFEVGSFTESGIFDNENIGLEIFATGQFKAEDNVFVGTSSSVEMFGARIKSTGDNTNRLHTNTFTDLSTAMHSVESNRDNSNAFVGLEFLCNTNTDNLMNDILADGGNPTLSGIRTFQGTSVGSGNHWPAANEFSTTSTSNFYNIKNETNNLIGYFYNPSITSQTPTVFSSNVYLMETSLTNPCVSIFDQPGYDLPLTGTLLTNTVNQYLTLEQDFLNVLYNLNQLIDNGNTPALLQEIQNTWSSEIWEMRSNLLEASPYLSYEAIVTAIETGILPPAIVLEICLANPDVTMQGNFLDWIEFDTNYPLPELLLDILKANVNFETPRSAVEQSLSGIHSTMALLKKDIMSSVLTDTTSSLTSKYNWLERNATNGEFFSLVQMQIANNDFNAAHSTLGLIASNNAGNESILSAVIDYESYLNFREAVADSNKTIANLDSSDLATLDLLSGASTVNVALMANNILCFFYNDCRVIENNEENQRTSKTPKPYKAVKEFKDQVLVFPNPAKDHSTILWTLVEPTKNAKLRIVDVKGALVKEVTIVNQRDQFIFEVASLQNAMYFYELINNGKVVQSGKINVQK